MNDRDIRTGMSYVAPDTSVEIRQTTVGAVLREAAATTPDQVALVEGAIDVEARRRWTYRELLRDAERVGTMLAARFEPGERVAVWAPNSPEWILLQYGVALAGLVLVTVNPAYKSDELAYALSQSRSAGMFYASTYRGNPMGEHLEAVRDRLPALREAHEVPSLWKLLDGDDATEPLPEVAAKAASQIQYTSGTTGMAKGATLHHLGITNNARFWSSRMELGASDVFVSPMPLFHAAGCINSVLSPPQQRATLVSLERFDAGLMLELIETYRGTHLLAVPTMLMAMMEHPDLSGRDLSSLRTVASGGATVPADLVRRIEAALGVRFVIVYGQTESSPAITFVHPTDTAEDKAMTLGPALPQTEMKVIDPNTSEIVPIGQQGELCVRGYLVMDGYFEMPDKTAEAIDGDQWLHTGDLVTMDGRGYLTITGRLKDMIIRGGENIYPREIEELLFEHQSVADAAVVGLPDDRWGEIVAAFIRDNDPANPASDDELRAYLRQRLAPHKTPSRWFHITEMPLTLSGKVQKFQLVDDYKNGNLALVHPSSDLPQGR